MSSANLAQSAADVKRRNRDYGRASVTRTVTRKPAACSTGPVLVAQAIAYSEHQLDQMPLAMAERTLFDRYDTERNHLAEVNRLSSAANLPLLLDEWSLPALYATLVDHRLQVLKVQWVGCRLNRGQTEGRYAINIGRAQPC